MKWNESKAIKELSGQGVTITGKKIVVKDGLKGLKKCSAYDYLRNYCGYTGIIR